MIRVEIQKLEELKSLYKKCRGQKALISQIMYVIRLQNEMAQMDGQIFHGYEKQIFERAMHIFLKHFVEQIQCVLELDSRDGLKGNALVIEKHAIIEDIQSAVIKMVEIFQSMMGSMKNADQPIFPVMTGSMYVFNASPKVITAYSQILNALTELLGCNDQYAFLLYPTMSDIIYTDILFKRRNKGGKVIVVTFPERLSEYPSVIPILFHEAFHVVERNIRCRKLRARCYWENILQQLEESVFGENVFLQEEIDEQKEIKDKLLDKWFNTVTDEFLKKLSNLKETDRGLYADRLVEEVGKKLSDRLIEIESEIYEDLETELLASCQKEDEFDFQGYCDVTSELHKCESVIRASIISMLTENMLYEAGEAYMEIYREGYADVAACLFLRLTPEDYDTAFQSSCQFEVSDKEYVDLHRILRQYLVSNALSTIWKTDEWQKKADEYESVIRSWNGGISAWEDSSKQGINGKKMVTVSLSEIALDSYKNYFAEVALKLYDYFETIPGIITFRRTVREVMNLNEDVMTNIFLGYFLIGQ